MPTYEYVCPKCGVFEEFHSITTQLTRCPKCNSEVRRLISQNTNVIFKGSGFYTTDYRSGSHSSSSGTSSPKTDTASPSSKPESKAS
ncbi:MAG TPA: zinc ribbon domain-containing protein [Bacillota bacterium]